MSHIDYPVAGYFVDVYRPFRLQDGTIYESPPAQPVHQFPALIRIQHMQQATAQRKFTKEAYLQVAMDYQLNTQLSLQPLKQQILAQEPSIAGALPEANERVKRQGGKAYRIGHHKSVGQISVEQMVAAAQTNFA